MLLQIWKILAIIQTRINFLSGSLLTQSNKGIIKYFYAKNKIPNRDAMPTPPAPLMKKRSKLPRVENQMAPPPKFYPDEEYKCREQKLPSPIQTTPQ